MYFANSRHIFIALAMVLIVLHLFSDAWLLLRRDWRAGFRWAYVRARRCLTGLLAREQADLLDECVARDVDACLVQNTRVLASTYSIFAMGILSIILWHEFAGSPRWMTRVQDFSVVFSAFCTLIVQSFPWVLNARTLDVWYSLLMFSICILLAASAREQYEVFRMSTTIILWRFLLTATIRRMAAATFWNVVYIMVQAFVYATTDFEERGNMVGYMLVECGATCAILLVTIFARSSLVHEIRHKIQVRTLSVESSAMASLLNLVCDVVVELDADLQITADVSKLATFLMLGARHQTKGISLQQYMPLAADRQHFETLIQSSAPMENANESSSLSGTCLPGAMHATLRDSMNNHIRVEMFLVLFQAFDGHRHYFVGIREFADQPIVNLKSFKSADVACTVAVEVGSNDNGANDDAGIASSSWGSSPPTVKHPPHLLQSLDEPGYTDVFEVGVTETANSDVSSSVGTCWASRRRLLADVRMRPTSGMAKRVTLMGAMLQWNFEVPPKSCCSFHAAVLNLHHHAKELLKHKCDSSFAPMGNAQCKSCGVVHHWADGVECMVCERNTVTPLSHFSL